jgi:hypothetical protein
MIAKKNNVIHLPMYDFVCGNWIASRIKYTGFLDLPALATTAFLVSAA